jgi:carbon monoxide dehydrogenase subunit G
MGNAMQLNGEEMIRAPRATVWAALNDPAVLARCIDGVDSLEPDGENRFRGTLDARVGPVRAKFSGSVSLTEIDAPNRYVLVGEGKGGVAGFARGSAEVTLHETPEGTRLVYAATSQVGGKLAQLGARLVEGAARGYAEAFFRNFREQVEAPEPPAPQAATGALAPDAAAAPAPPVEPAGGGIPPLVWAGLLLLLVAITLYLLVG